MSRLMDKRIVFPLLCACFAVLGLLAWDPSPNEGRPVTAGKDGAGGAEAQQNTRAISLRMLEEADSKINDERQKLLETERRLKMLKEELANNSETLSAQEARIQDLISTAVKQDDQFILPAYQVVHWESRAPKTAAPDFIGLYHRDSKVAISLVKQMKKKKSARLMDEVVKLQGGKEVAVKINEAIGEGQ